MKKRLLTAVLALALALTLLPATAMGAEGDAPWAVQAVKTLNGIYDGGVFKAVDENMTLDEAAEILEAMGYKGEKLPEPAGDNDAFTRGAACEVLADFYNLPIGSESAIEYLNGKNIVNGYADGDLGEENAVTHAQFAVIAFRVLNSVGGGKNTSVAGLTPGTREYTSWMYLMTRSCLQEDDSPADTMDEETWEAWTGKLTDLAEEDDKPQFDDFENAFDEEITKAEAAAVIVFDILKDTKVFKDVEPDAAYYDGVMYLFDHGIVMGYGDDDRIGTFGPTDELERSHLAVLLYRADGYSGGGQDHISAAKAHAVERKYMTPGEEAEDWWGAKATREEVIVGIMKQQGVDVSSVNTAILERFSDAGDITEDAAPYVAYAVSCGMVNGGRNGDLSPQSEATRAQAGVILYRALIGLDTTKMKDYADNVTYATGEAPEVSYSAAASVLSARSVHYASGVTALADEPVEKTLTLTEDWRLTTDMDLNIPEGTTLTINGNGHFIYELGGRLLNSGLGTVQFQEKTVLYPAADDKDAAAVTVEDQWDNGESDELMRLRQPHAIEIGELENGSVTASPETAKWGSAVTLTVTPDEGYALSDDGLTVVDEDGAAVELTGEGGSFTFTMPASKVTISASFETHTHAYSPEWSHDATGHWHACTSNTCDAPQADYAAHSGGTATTTVQAVCEVCGTAYGSLLPPSGDTGASGGSGSSSSSSTTTVSVTSSKNGTVSASPKNAKKDDTVTLTVKPSAGYELDELTVTDKNGKTVKVTEGKNGKFTFTMPATKVTVEATFVKIEEAPKQNFADVPAGYWAEDAIAWAAENGYMNGNSTDTFNPEGTVTRQQLWMILARLSGYQPADFTEAKAWAVDNNISDGTIPGNAVSRQQLVTILYRYAVRMGYSTGARVDLTQFPDHTSVAPYATDAMAWSVANGIVGGTTQGTLNPAGTATRAQFAVILNRFCEKIG